MNNKVVTQEVLMEKDVGLLIKQADNIIINTIRNVNYELINMYWNLGKLLTEYKKENDSSYGEAVITRFSDTLSIRYGSGFGWRNLYRAIQFYELFSNLSLGTNSSIVLIDRQFKNISWSHIRELLRFKDVNIIKYYLNEVENKKLSRDELRVSIKSKAYERTIINQSDGNIRNEIERNLKDPIILNIEKKKRSEKQLEDEIIKNIVNFKKEIGNKIMFLESQYKINNNGLRYKVDIVLYDKDNRNFIIIDLKIDKVKQRDIDQMKFYVDYFNRYVMDDNDNQTIGLILVETKDIRVETSDDIYQIKYLSDIPKDQELKRIISENKIILLKTEKLKVAK